MSCVRCGRCGLYNRYPLNHYEQKYSGVCLWYLHRLIKSDEYEPRVCSDYLEAIPDLSPMSHFDYKTKRGSLHDVYFTALRVKRLAYLGVCLSIVALIAKFF